MTERLVNHGPLALKCRFKGFAKLLAIVLVAISGLFLYHLHEKRKAHFRAREETARAAYAEIYSKIVAKDFEPVLARVPEGRRGALRASMNNFQRSFMEGKCHPESIHHIVVHGNRAEIYFAPDSGLSPDGTLGLGDALYLNEEVAGWYLDDVLGGWATPEYLQWLGD